MKIPEQNIRYVDVPEIQETFVDSVGLSMFDGSVLRLELCVSRFDRPEPPNAPKVRRYPAARLILTPQATIDLFNNLQNFIAGMQKAGVLKVEEIQKEPPGKH